MTEPIKAMGSQELRVFLRGGCARLGSKQEEVNALNVFPVPDGDTGVNMYLTVASGEKKMLTAAEGASLGKLAGDFSMGTLMGARGNSGVILSQMFRGLSLALQNVKQADAAAFAAALQKGVDLSYILSGNEDPEYEENFYSLIRNLSRYDTGKAIGEGDRLLTLVTCLEHQPQYRQIIVCREMGRELFDG